MRSWKSYRDELVIKQSLDNSCGAASLATLLRSYYSHDVSEADILSLMDAQKGRASLQDLSDVAAKLGFKSQGYSTTWTQLSKLKLPVILYMPLETGEHFSVLRGISSESVWLADPSSGNRKYSKHQFLEMWTKPSQSLEVARTGKMLVVLPNQSASVLKPRPIINHAFFLTNSLHTADHAITPSVSVIPLLEGRY